MDELKILVDMVSKLPQMALWVLAGYFIYKLAIVGSIYGTIRFVAERAYRWGKMKKSEPVLKHEHGIFSITLQSDGANDEVLRLLKEIRGVGHPGTPKPFNYVTHEDALWLRHAVDEQRKRDRQA